MFDFLAIQTLNGLVYSILLFLLALGLSLTFGLLSGAFAARASAVRRMSNAAAA